MPDRDDMTINHPSSGVDISAALWRAQRLDEVNAPTRVRNHLAVALDIAGGMDENDSDLKALALVLIHCTRAICCAVDGRT
jgi:hypothetical protein